MPSPLSVANFGRNLAMTPQVIAAPESEDEVIELLRAHGGRRLRAVGSLHSWSRAPEADDVLVDLRHLNQVSVTGDPNGWVATIGAGCRIKRALSELDARGLTLPTLGLITEQTIAGAIATGTHGSGRHSISHYVTCVRLACYDPATGEPVIREIRSGDELRAARCAVGSLGIVLSVELRPRPQYRILEWMRLHDKLESVLAAEADAPLQQFYLLPWSWNYLVQHRRESERARSWLAPLYRAYWFVVIDIALHAVMSLLAQWLRYRFVKSFYQWLVPVVVVRHWNVVDRSQSMLVMEHELFVHIEVELFVKRSRLAEAMAFVRQVIQVLDGEPATFSERIRQQLVAGELDELAAAAGSYRHHYPICVRRVLPDDTLLSMSAASDEPYYAISFISYARPTDRDGFFRFARLLTRAMRRLFGARPHWGKVCELTRAELDELYPHVDRFREIRRLVDPGGVFMNAWTEQLLS